MASGRRARPIMTPASSAAPRSVRRSRPRAEQAPLESSSDWWKTSRTSSARITLPLELGLKSSCWLRAAWREPLAGWADDRCALSRGHPPTIRVAGEDVDVPARRRPRLTLVVPAHLCAPDDNRRRVVQTYLAVIDVTLDLIERQGGRRHHGNEVGLVRHRPAQHVHDHEALNEQLAQRAAIGREQGRKEAVIDAEDVVLRAHARSVAPSPVDDASPATIGPSGSAPAPPTAATSSSVSRMTSAMFRERIVMRPTPPRPRATELINNGVSIEADRRARPTHRR